MNFSEKLAMAGELELTDSELEMVYGGAETPGEVETGETGETGGEPGGEFREGGEFRGGEGFGFDDYPWWPEYYEPPFPWFRRRRHRYFW